MALTRLAGKSTRNKSEVSQTLDASKVLGVDLSNHPRIVEEFGQAVIDKIIDRTTEDQVDVKGNPFANYSTSYVNSEEFKDAGKSSSEINLEQSGDMIDSLDFDREGTLVKVAVGDSEAAKAYGNMTGKRGKTKKSINPRDFFGVSAKDLKEIRELFTDEVQRVKEEPTTASEQDQVNLASVLTVGETEPRELFSEVFGDIFNVES